MPNHQTNHTPNGDRAPGRPAGRGWAYAGAVLGGVVSVAANIAHSYVPPATLPATLPATVLAGEAGSWTPEPGAVVAAVFWPVALLVAVEILARTAWPAGRRWAVLRYAGLLPVALVAAVVSYRHLSGLIAHYGEPGLTAVVGPLAVDGLMVMATGALIATAHSTTPAPGAAVATSPTTAPAALPVTAAAGSEVSTQYPQNPQNPQNLSAPAGAGVAAQNPQNPQNPTPAPKPRPARTTPARKTPARKTPAPSAGTAGAAVEVAELVPLGRAIADRLAAQGRTLTRAALRDELRADGRSLSNARAGQLLALLKNDDTPAPADADRTDEHGTEHPVAAAPVSSAGAVRADDELLMEAS